LKCFWGTFENRGRIRIHTAIIACNLVAIVGCDLKIDYSTYEILQVLGLSLLGKIPDNELLTKIDYKDVNELDYNLLLFS
jgi:hypothetical protein